MNTAQKSALGRVAALTLLFVVAVVVVMTMWIRGNPRGQDVAKFNAEARKSFEKYGR